MVITVQSNCQKPTDPLKYYNFKSYSTSTGFCCNLQPTNILKIEIFVLINALGI